MITETPRVQAALDELRSELPDGERLDFAELVTLGAWLKARRLRVGDDAARAARRRLAEMVRTRSFPFQIDVDAADEAKRSGLIAHHE